MLRLGSVACPSGRLVVADAGYLGLWSGLEPPVAGEALLSQISDPQVRAGVAAAVDMNIVGVDAERAVGRGGEQFVMHGVPVVALGDLPEDCTLAVSATLRDFGGQVGVQWGTITISVRDGQITETRSLGHVGVDWARLILADADGLNAWQHEDPIDGLADVASGAVQWPKPGTDCL